MIELQQVNKTYCCRKRKTQKTDTQNAKNSKKIGE